MIYKFAMSTIGETGTIGIWESCIGQTIDTAKIDASIRYGDMNSIVVRPFNTRHLPIQEHVFKNGEWQSLCNDTETA